MRFGPFDFDPDSGELWSEDGGRHAVGRLPPQPARLLAHLIARRPDIVSQEEIRELLWAGVSVEFEESLHSCVRKIRGMLGDSATAPTYIETVPKRGYRFIGAMPADTDRPEPVQAPMPASARTGPWRWLVLAAALLVVVLGLAARSGVAPVPQRIAVMPFEPVAADSALTPGNGLAEAIVSQLVARRGPPMEVIGPTTTEAYAGRLSTLIADFHIDYVINGRESTGPAGPRVLVEIIRASDGAHVWVRYLDELPASEAAELIASAVK